METPLLNSRQEICILHGEVLGYVCGGATVGFIPHYIPSMSFVELLDGSR
jgi:hypothetical protein